MRSSGGVTSFDRAATNPISLLESGPVAGVEAAAELGRRLGAQPRIGARHRWDDGEDLGSARRPPADRDHVPRRADAPVRRLPVADPVVQIVEIGAGGGSIAWPDGAGGLHVGPKSAGADPGPACYGRGGGEPTLTDANLVAGRLDPSYFLGGAMKLDVDAARRGARTSRRVARDST